MLWKAGANGSARGEHVLRRQLAHPQQLVVAAANKRPQSIRKRRLPLLLKIQRQLVGRVDGALELAEIHQPVAVGVEARDGGGSFRFRFRNDGGVSVSQRQRQRCDR